MQPSEVRKTREKLGLSTQELADALECTVRSVQMWESGERNIPGPARVALRFMLQAKRSTLRE
jgi:putative transcriptional regulator